MRVSLWFIFKHTSKQNGTSKHHTKFIVGGCIQAQCGGSCRMQWLHAPARFFARFEKSRLMEDFNVTAVCAKGYNKGKAIVTMCKEPGQPYLLTGCGAGSCTEPSAKAAFDYRYTAYSLESLKSKAYDVCPRTKMRWKMMGGFWQTSFSKSRLFQKQTDSTSGGFDVASLLRRCPASAWR